MLERVSNNSPLWLFTVIFPLAILEMAIQKTKIRRLFICILIISCVLNMSFASDLMRAIWDEEMPLRKSCLGDSVSDEESKTLIRCLSKLPLTDRIKSDVWYKILRYRKVENLDLIDWQRYEPLIPNLPAPMLRQVNFSNEVILSYFGQQKLNQIQLSQLAEEMIYRNEDVLSDEEKIVKLGNIFCGFSSSEITTIKDSTLRSLLDKNFFQTIKACSIEQLRVLVGLMRQYTVIGPPRTWEPETVKKAGTLIAGLKPLEIREIRESSFSQISSDVITLIPVETLQKIKDSQLKYLNRSALLAWRRKTRVLKSLYMGRSSSFSMKVSFVTVALSLFV